MKVNEHSTKWEDVWELPLSKYDYVDYVDSSNGVLALSHFKDEWVFNEDDAAINKIVSIINGEIDSDFLPEWEADGCDILYQGAGRRASCCGLPLGLHRAGRPVG